MSGAFPAALPPTGGSLMASNSWSMLCIDSAQQTSAPAWTPVPPPAGSACQRQQAAHMVTLKSPQV